MRRLPAIALIAALLSSCGEDRSPPPPKASGGGIPWLASLDEALSRAKSSGKPVLLHFYTPE